MTGILGARFRSLFLLLLTAGFAAVFAQETNAPSARAGQPQPDLRRYFLSVCCAPYLPTSDQAPQRRPLPVFRWCAADRIGVLVMVYRIDESLARDQANWCRLRAGPLRLTIHFLRDYHVLDATVHESPRSGCLLLLAPRCLASASQVHGAYPRRQGRPSRLQPAEFSKILHRSSSRQLPLR